MALRGVLTPSTTVQVQQKQAPTIETSWHSP